METPVIMPTDIEKAVASLTTLQEELREETNTLYNLVDFADSMSFSRDDGTKSLSVPMRFDFATAFSMAYQRPSATSCAYVTEAHLFQIQAASRAFCTLNPYWMAIRESRISYVVGTGHIVSAVARDKRKTLPAGVAVKILEEIESFQEMNQYRRLQGERLTRCDRDGECYLWMSEQDGMLRVRFLEPRILQTPPGLGPPDTIFGISFRNKDYTTPVRYHFKTTDYAGQFSDAAATEWHSGLPAKDVQRRTANVDASSPRGLPTTYTIQEALVQAVSTRKAMGKLVDVRARIAVVAKQVNATLGQLQPLLDLNRIGQITRSGGKLTNAFNYPYGSIINTNDQRSLEFPSQNIETDKIVHALKADLQSAAAAVGLADFVISGDSTSSFANSLIKEGPMDRAMSRLQQDMIDDDIVVYKRALEVAVRYGRLQQSDLDQVRLELTPPIIIARERLQHTQADEILIRNGAMSPDTMAMRANLDPDDERDRIKHNPPPERSGKGTQLSTQPSMSGKPTARGIPAGAEPGPGLNPQRHEEGLAESSHDAKSLSAPTSEDRAMAALLLTPEWLAKTKAEILAIPRTSQPVAPESAGEYEPGIKGTYLGVVDNQQVWAVDMRAMSVKYDMPDLVVAGNSVRWPSIPADRILVDWAFTAADRACSLLHECVEFLLMSLGQWAYGRAHRMANDIEMVWLLNELRPELQALKLGPN
jgi:hypothetical protein